jgi:hypothetical protein
MDPWMRLRTPPPFPSHFCSYTRVLAKEDDISHCKDATPKMLNKYSKKRNCATSFPISNMEIGTEAAQFPMWKLGLRRRNSFLGIYKWYFRCSSDFFSTMDIRIDGSRKQKHKKNIIPLTSPPTTAIF